MCVKCLAAAEANELTAKLANTPPVAAAAAAADIMMRVHTALHLHRGSAATATQKPSMK